jgi:hypothetical protein
LQTDLPRVVLRRRGGGGGGRRVAVVAGRRLRRRFVRRDTSAFGYGGLRVQLRRAQSLGVGDSDSRELRLQPRRLGFELEAAAARGCSRQAGMAVGIKGYSQRVLTAGTKRAQGYSRRVLTAGTQGANRGPTGNSDKGGRAIRAGGFSVLRILDRRSALPIFPHARSLGSVADSFGRKQQQHASTSSSLNLRGENKQTEARSHQRQHTTIQTNDRNGTNRRLRAHARVRRRSGIRMASVGMAQEGMAEEGMGLSGL